MGRARDFEMSSPSGSKRPAVPPPPLARKCLPFAYRERDAVENSDSNRPTANYLISMARTQRLELQTV